MTFLIWRNKNGKINAVNLRYTEKIIIDCKTGKIIFETEHSRATYDNDRLFDITKAIEVLKNIDTTSVYNDLDKIFELERKIYK